MIFVAVFLGVGLSYAYFTARATREGELFFANVSVDFVTSEDKVYTTAILNQQLSKIEPGGKYQVNTIYLKNTGECAVYALAEVTFNATKHGESAPSYTASSWYNLSGTEITGNKATTTMAASLIEIGVKTSTRIIFTVPGELDNSYKAGTATLNIKAHVIQSLLEAESGVSKAVTASRLIYQNKDNADVEHTVYIRPNGGTYNSQTENLTVSQDRGTTLTLSTPTRTGYTFKGWSFTGDGSLSGSTYTFGKSVGSITATWQASNYTVSFNANGGTVDTTSKSVAYDGTYGDLPTPTRAGYTFNGWLGATVVPDLSMWELFSGATYNSKTGAIDLFSSSARAESPLIYVNDIKSLYINAYISSSASDAGCYFLVRYYSTATSTFYSSNGFAKTFEAQNIPLNEYTWVKTMYGASTQLLSGTCNYIKIYIYRHETLAPADYSIGNVQILTDKSTSEAKEFITSSTLVKTASNHALVAQWTANNYTVNFDANGGNVSTTSKSVTYNGTYGELPTPTREGYTFVGWQGVNMFDKSKYLLTSDYVQTTPYTYAPIKLEPNTTYVVSVYRKNGYAGTTGYLLLSASNRINDNWTAITHSSSPNTSNANFIYTTGSTGELYIGYHASVISQSNLNTIWANTDVVIEKQTSSSKGAYYNSTTASYDSSYQPFISQGYVTSGTKMQSTVAHTLVAQWQASNYKVSFNANGGTVSTTSKSVTYNGTYGELPTPTREGYTFLGWAKDIINDTGSRQVTDSQSYCFYSKPLTENITSNTTYYIRAKVKANAGQKLCLYLDGGYGASPKNVAGNGSWVYLEGTFTTGDVSGFTHGGTKVISLYNVPSSTCKANPASLDGIIFTCVTNGTKTSSTIVDTAADHTLYAQWKKN